MSKPLAYEIFHDSEGWYVGLIAAGDSYEIKPTRRYSNWAAADAERERLEHEDVLCDRLHQLFDEAQTPERDTQIRDIEIKLTAIGGERRGNKG